MKRKKQNQMSDIFGKSYYIDLEAITTICRMAEPSKVNKSEVTDMEDEQDGEANEITINVFKYEVLKMMVDRVLNEIDEVDEEMGVFAQNTTTISFRLAFNTLLKYGIIIEEND